MTPADFERALKALDKWAENYPAPSRQRGGVGRNFGVVWREKFTH